MSLVKEITGASNQIWNAQNNGATWEEITDDMKHYSALTCALEDRLNALIDDRTKLEYESAMLVTAMTDVLHHFTKSKSTLKDSEIRCMGHNAIERMLQTLHSIGAKTIAEPYVPCYSTSIISLVEKAKGNSPSQ